MRLAKSGLLEPHETFQVKHSNTYFMGTKGLYSSGGVSDDHLPFLQRSNNSLSFILALIVPLPLILWATEELCFLPLHPSVHVGMPGRGILWSACRRIVVFILPRSAMKHAKKSRSRVS